MRILVTEPIIEEGLAALRELGDVEVRTVRDQAALAEAVRTYDAIVPMLSNRFDESVFSAAEGLKIVANYAVGYDNIDLAAATRAGVWVTNTPDVLTNATAEMAWALLFAAARRIIEGDALSRVGGWKGWGPTQLVGQSVSGKTLGVVGAGRIGTAFAKMSAGFRMDVLYWSRREKAEMPGRFVALEELFAQSDFISIHLPKSDETARLISKDLIGRMKPTAILVNTGRGSVVDEDALAEALAEKRIAAAGLDVYEREPIIHPRLPRLSNVVLAPHLGSATTEARVAMAKRCALNISAVFRNERPPDALNTVK